MPSPTDFPARGVILRVENNIAVFKPLNTTYELHLAMAAGKTLAASPKIVNAIIRATARKVWTVPSGGNFITPIMGNPRIAQGRVRYLDDRTMILHAAVPIVITLPLESSAYDLINGAVAAGSMMNATLLPGATVELASTPAIQAVPASGR